MSESNENARARPTASTDVGVGQKFQLFIRNLPRDITDDELRGLFGVFGEIEDCRLMKYKTGNCKGYAFIDFKRKSDGLEAMHRLNGVEIRPWLYLDITRAKSNCRLFVGNIPKSKGRDELLEEFRKITPELKSVITYRSPDETFRKNRGFCFLEYENHAKASHALKRLMLHKPNRFFDCDYLVDWADEEEEPEDEVMAQVKVVYVKNLSSNINEEQLRAVFGICGEIGRVKKIKSFAFIHFLNRKDAEEAISTLNGKKLGGTNIEVVWARPPTDKVKKEEILRNREFRTTQLMMGNTVKPNSVVDAETERVGESSNYNSFQNFGPVNRNRYLYDHQIGTPYNSRNERNNNSGFGDQMSIQAKESDTSTCTLPSSPSRTEKPPSYKHQEPENQDEFVETEEQNAEEYSEQPLPGFPLFVPQQYRK